MGRASKASNAPNRARVAVDKDFSDNNDTDDVTVTLVCTSGTVTENDNTATEADDANFEVVGFTVGATCDATESNVPAGYEETSNDCDDLALVHTQLVTCTIVNTLREDTFIVRKDFSDDNDDLPQHRVRVGGDWNDADGWSVSAHGDVALWDQENAVSLGVYVQRSF